MVVFNFMEVWKKIEGFENYEVSNYGNVRNIKTNRVLKPDDLRGYKKVLLYNNGFKKKFQIHRLVAICFIENKQNKPCVNHIDGNPSNNNVKNLEWCTYSENEKHSFDVLKKVTGGISRRKIDLKDIEKIKKLSLKGLSQRDISKLYNVSHSTIGNILRCQTYIKHI